jgi:hypothetical protein
VNYQREPCGPGGSVLNSRLRTLAVVFMWASFRHSSHSTHGSSSEADKKTPDEYGGTRSQ